VETERGFFGVREFQELYRNVAVIDFCGFFLMRCGVDVVQFDVEFCAKFQNMCL
jgi:hypothetical protein